MDRFSRKPEDGRNPKRGSGAGGLTLAPMEAVLGWLEFFHARYHWTESELMDTDLLYALSLIVIKEKIENSPRLTPIDQAGFF